MGSDTMPKKTSKSSKTKSSPPKWKIQTPSSTKTKKEHRYRQLRKENEEKLSPFKNSPARPKFVQFDSQNVPNTRPNNTGHKGSPTHFISLEINPWNNSQFLFLSSSRGKNDCDAKKSLYIMQLLSKTRFSQLFK